MKMKDFVIKNVKEGDVETDLKITIEVSLESASWADVDRFKQVMGSTVRRDLELQTSLGEYDEKKNRKTKKKS